MTVYGKCKLPVQISEWQAHIEAIVIDLDAEFGFVLDRSWHKQYNARTHWESMIMEITSERKQYWLMPYPRRLGSIEGESNFGCNVISPWKRWNNLARRLYYILYEMWKWNRYRRRIQYRRCSIHEYKAHSMNTKMCSWTDCRTSYLPLTVLSMKLIPAIMHLSTYNRTN